MLGVSVFGATGRMGREVLKALQQDQRFQLTGAGCSVGNPLEGQPVSCLQPGITDTCFGSDPARVLAHARVAIDFSLPEATVTHLEACVASGIPLVLCVTGQDPAQKTLIEAASRQIPVLVAANTSLGINVLGRLVELAAQALGDDYDVEIMEAHHRFKRDLPSGTALQLGRAAARGRGSSLEELQENRLPGTDRLRTPGSIGFSAVRAGDISGEHTVMLAGQGERLELVHRVASRATFAVGALRAAYWLADQQAGLYQMGDALELK
jgi:4-hydroxy-tetrahydrodipicolinate reductase